MPETMPPPGYVSPSALENLYALADADVIRDSRLPPLNLHGMAIVLRDRTLWPRDFTWDYRKSGQCMLGLAAAIGWLDAPHMACFRAVFEIGVFRACAFALFVRPSDGRGMKGVTPEDVAGAIERYLAR